jgi:hypothetical protein
MMRIQTALRDALRGVRIKVERCPIHKTSKPCAVCERAFILAAGQRERQSVAERQELHKQWLRNQRGS